MLIRLACFRIVRSSHYLIAFVRERKACVTCAQSMAQGCSSGCTDSAMKVQVRFDWCSRVCSCQWQDQPIRSVVLNEYSGKNGSMLNAV